MKTPRFRPFALSRFLLLVGLSALSPQLSAQRLLDSVTLGGTNHVKSGGSFLIDSGATFNFSAGTLIGVWPIANGGTNANSASAARTSLGLAIGTNVQAYNANLTTYAGITPSANIQTFLGAADYAAMRTQLGLVIGTNVQAYNANLTSYAGVAPSANVLSLLGAANYAAMRTQLTLTIGTDVQAYNANLTTYAAIAPSANIQTFLGAADYAAMRTQLSLVPGTNVLAKPGSEALGDILYWNGSVWTRLARGSDTQVLKSTATTIAWGTDSTGSGSLPGSPATGDLAYYDGANWVSLAIGTAGQVLAVNGGATAPQWSNGGASVATSTSTGTQNDFSFSNASLLRMNNATATTITGLAAGSAGQRLQIVSIGAGQVNLTNQDAGSTSTNRIINPVTGTISLAAGTGVAELVYDATTARWRVVAHRQGALIAVAHSGGNFTGSGSLTWTVASGDQATFAYVLNGRVLTVYLVLDTTTVSGSGSALQVAIPGGFSASTTLYQAMAIADNGTFSTGLCQVVSGTTIYIYRNIAGTNWSAATDTTYVRGSISFDVQ